MGKTTIEWTRSADGSPGHTWNPVTGCSKVSPGCDHCYAEAISLRFKRSVGPWTGANARANVVLHPERLAEPLKIKKPSMIFVCSMADLFHELVPFHFIQRVFRAMAASPQHTFQVLTKRPGRLAYFANGYLEEPEDHAANEEDRWCNRWPANVWAGTSVESAKYLPRLDVLARVPAKVRFVSAEPLLGPLDLEPYLVNPHDTDWIDGQGYGATLQWVIVGGESGPGARPMNPDWVRGIRDQCVAAGVPLFVKQDSGPRPGKQGRLSDELWAYKQFPGQGLAKA